jgi:hypothetical protein
LRALNQSYDRARQRIVSYQLQTTPIYSEHLPPFGLPPGWSRIPLRY